MYRRRDEEDAGKLGPLLVALGCRAEGRKVLDIGCGHGRHLRVLQDLGADAYGIDLSPVLLAEARSRRPDERVVLADMRSLPFRNDVFEVGLLLFTTFGYFETDREHLRVLEEAGRVLKHDGLMVIDTMNASWVRTHLVPETRRDVDTVTVAERRWIDEGRCRILKTVDVREREGARGVAESWTESVRLWTAEELEHLLNQAGFSVARWAGGFDGNEFSEQTSERMIVLARKKG